MMKKNKEKGFTLLEVIIASSILAILMATAGSILVKSQNFYADRSRQEGAHIQAKIIMDRIISELRDVREDWIYKTDGEVIFYNEENSFSDLKNIAFHKIINVDGNQSAEVYQFLFKQTDLEKSRGEGHLVLKVGDKNPITIGTNIVDQDNWAGHSGSRVLSLNGISFSRNGRELKISLSVQKYTKIDTKTNEKKDLYIANYQTQLTLREEKE